MVAKKAFYTWLAVWMSAALLAACNPAGLPMTSPATVPPAVAATLTPTETVPAPTVPPAPATPTTEQATVSPTTEQATVSPTLPPPTPELGSAIQHFAAGRKIDITNIRMVDTKAGWGIGGLSQASDHVFRTQDGGLTWHDVTPPEPASNQGEQVRALGFFRDASTGWVVYGPPGGGPIPPYILVWSTQDGGASWSYSPVYTSISSGEDFSPWFFNFADDQHGWLMVLLGAGMMHSYVAIFATQDGGKTWNDVLDPYSDGSIQSFGKTGMVFVDAQNGWLTRDGRGVDPVPHVFRTSDGGATWKRIDLPAPVKEPSLYDQWACGTYSPNVYSPRSVILAMKCLDLNEFKTERDYIYSTTNGGATWKTSLLPAQYSLGQGLLFSDPKTGLALGRQIFSTNDGGQAWSPLKQVDWDGQFSFVDRDHGWAVATNQGAIALVSTTDGGKIWGIIKPVVAP